MCIIESQHACLLWQRNFQEETATAEKITQNDEPQSLKKNQIKHFLLVSISIHNVVMHDHQNLLCT